MTYTGLQCLWPIYCLFLNCVFFVQLMFFVLHMEKGTPFETNDQGKSRYQTVWEQLDYGVQFSASKKFLTVVPIVLWVRLHFTSVSFRPQIVRLNIKCSVFMQHKEFSNWLRFADNELAFYLCAFFFQIFPGQFLHKIWFVAFCSKWVLSHFIKITFN